MSIRERILKLCDMGLYEEMFELLATQPGGGNILNELLGTDERLLDPYVDWITKIMLELSRDVVFHGVMVAAMKRISPEKYLLFDLINRGVRNGGQIPVDEYRTLIVDLFGQGELDLLEVRNPGFLDGETGTVKDCLKMGLRDKFMPMEGLGRA